MRKTIGILLAAIVAATIFAACGKNVEGSYGTEDGFMLVLTGDKAWSLSNQTPIGKLVGTYEIDGDKIKFTATESETSLTLTDGTIDGDKITVAGFDKPFVVMKK